MSPWLTSVWRFIEEMVGNNQSRAKVTVFLTSVDTFNPLESIGGKGWNLSCTRNSACAFWEWFTCGDKLVWPRYLCWWIWRWKCTSNGPRWSSYWSSARMGKRKKGGAEPDKDAPSSLYILSATNPVRWDAHIKWFLFVRFFKAFPFVSLFVASWQSETSVLYFLIMKHTDHTQSYFSLPYI